MEFRQFIGGEWTGAGNGGSWELVNPATEEVIDLIPFGDGADAIAALDAATECLSRPGATPLPISGRQFSKGPRH